MLHAEAMPGCRGTCSPLPQARAALPLATQQACRLAVLPCLWAAVSVLMAALSFWQRLPSLCDGRALCLVVAAVSVARQCLAVPAALPAGMVVMRKLRGRGLVWAAPAVGPAAVCLRARHPR